jgi:hypothetical protein
MLYRGQLTLAGFELATLVLIGTYCRGRGICKSNNYTITTTRRSPTARHVTYIKEKYIMHDDVIRYNKTLKIKGKQIIHDNVTRSVNVTF